MRCDGCIRVSDGVAIVFSIALGYYHSLIGKCMVDAINDDPSQELTVCGLMGRVTYEYVGEQPFIAR